MTSKRTNEARDVDVARARRIGDDREALRPVREARDREYRAQAKALRRDLQPKRGGESGPTPHTLRQHRKTSYERMIEAKQVTPEMQQAAQEIERVYLAQTGAVLCRAQTYERQDRGAASPHSESIALAYHFRYKPWADELARRHRACAWPMLEVVIDVVVDGRPLDVIDRERSWEKGLSKFIVRWALMDYAEKAGWAKRGARKELESAHGLRRAPKHFFAQA